MDCMAWIYWDHDWREKKLKVLRVVTPANTGYSFAEDGTAYRDDQRVADIQVLLEAALAEASEWGFQKVLVWNPDEILTLGAKAVSNANEDVKVIFDERLDASVPNFRWNGGEGSHKHGLGRKPLLLLVLIALFGSPGVGIGFQCGLSMRYFCAFNGNPLMMAPTEVQRLDTLSANWFVTILALVIRDSFSDITGRSCSNHP